MLQQSTGCSNEAINHLSYLISYILETILHIHQEDKSNKLDMLRKIECEVLLLQDKRFHIFDS